MNRRMLAILLDVSSMQPDDVQRAVEDSREWVSEKMTGADLVAIITIGTRLNVLTDFTSSKEEALAALQTLAYNEGTEVNPEAIATAATEADGAAADAATTTEADAFQEFNNDVRLRALKTVCQELAPIQQKKALLYFSAGMSRSGDDNQIELRSATSTCNRGNVSIYAVDTRGLQAVAAGGSASRRGNGGSLLTRAAAWAASSRSTSRRRRSTRWRPIPAGAPSPPRMISAKRSRASSATSRPITCSATRAPIPRVTESSAAFRSASSIVPS